MRVLILTSLLIATVAASAASRRAASQNAVSRAIEQTKSRQRPAQAAPGRAINRKKSANNPGRNEVVDVPKLNKLLQVLDKTWVLPREGAKEPVGSNFQYKKTCSSIFKARHGACQQLGFGIMCFNYCHERGEKLSFACQDASDAAYCRQSGTFETFLAKYRKDSYKAKAYIHQMISRCFATSICNTQTGMLNSTIIDEAPEIVERKTTKMNRLKLLTRRITKQPQQAPKEATTTTTVAPEVEETTVPPTTAAIMEAKRASPRPGKGAGKPDEPVKSTTENTNIWDKFTVGDKAKPTSKYIPFWQKLMSTTTVGPKPKKKVVATTEEPLATPEPEVVVTESEPEEEEVFEESEEEEEEDESMETTTTTRKPKSKKRKSSRRKSAQKQQVATETSEDQLRHTFKPLPMTTPPPPGPELAFQKPAEENSEHGPGFLYRFQPNRWFQSIHYVTNTGK